MPILRIHPRYLIDPSASLAVDLAIAQQGGGFGGGPLPQAGGWLDQAASTMHAILIVSNAMARIREHKFF